MSVLYRHEMHSTGKVRFLAFVDRRHQQSIYTRRIAALSGVGPTLGLCTRYHGFDCVHWAFGYTMLSRIVLDNFVARHC